MCLTTDIYTINQSLGATNELIISNNMDEENTAYIYDMMERGGKAGVLKVGENVFSLDELRV